MSLLSIRKKEHSIDLQEEQINDGLDTKLFIDESYLTNQIEKISEKNKANLSSNPSLNPVFIDRKTIEERVVQTINALDDEEKSDLGIHLIPIIREILDDELKDILVEKVVPTVAAPTEKDFISAGTNNEVEENNDDIGLLISKEELIEKLSLGELNKLSIACVYASNKNRVKSLYGVNACENINKTILDIMCSFFIESQIYRIDEDKYVVYNFNSEPREFISKVNDFRKSIYSINTSNQYKYPIEINVGDSNGRLFETVDETFERAYELCMDKEENEIEYKHEKTCKEEQVVEKKTSYQSMEYYDDIEVNGDINKSTIQHKSPQYIKLCEKDISDFPTVTIDASMIDKELNEKTDIRLTVNFIEKSAIKQEVLVSGYIGNKEILLTSVYNDERTTIELDENAGLILRFGTTTKLFILKEKKQRYELSQKIIKNTFEKNPLIIEDMCVCPLSASGTDSAFIFNQFGKYKLIKTDETGRIILDGKCYKCYTRDKLYSIDEKVV